MRKSSVRRMTPAMHELYEPIRRNCTSTPEMTKKMDACVSLTAEICDLVKKDLEKKELLKRC